jgi:hypothetical protein
LAAERKKKKERNCTAVKDLAGCWIARLRAREPREMVLDPAPGRDPADSNGWVRYRGQHVLVAATRADPPGGNCSALVRVDHRHGEAAVSLGPRERYVSPWHGHAQGQGLIGCWASRIRKAAFALRGLQLLTHNRPRGVLMRSRGSRINSASCPTVPMPCAGRCAKTCGCDDEWLAAKRWWPVTVEGNTAAGP